MLRVMLLALGLCFSVSAGQKDVQLPVLNWVKLSDWHSVKDYGARGDGKADDSAAIQKLYDMASRGKVITIYFPPGKYRITKTLTLEETERSCMLSDMGEDTVLFWDGKKGGSIYLSNGVHRSRL